MGWCPIAAAQRQWSLWRKMTFRADIRLVALSAECCLRRGPLVLVKFA